ncbi:hypothetical protein [Nonomuraea angiospora]
MRRLDASTIIRQVWEGLELPGEPEDNHFLMQSVVSHPWSNIRGLV